MAQNGKENTSGNIMNLHTVLVSRLSVLGDVVMAVPVLYSVCRSYPDIKFVMLTSAKFARVFVDAPPNLSIETHDNNSCYSMAAKLMHKYNYDIFIDLQNDSSTRMLRLYCSIHGVKMIKFNRDTGHSRSLTRRSNKVMLPMASARARYRAAFFAAGIPDAVEFNGLFGECRQTAPPIPESLTPHKAPGEKWIGIAPFAAYPTKEYPLEKMETVIKALANNTNTRIFIFGDKGREAEIAHKWQQSFPCITSLAGGTHDFASELALMSALDVMLTMDSANMQMAAICGTPTVSIWGATHYYCGFRAWHQGENDMVQLPLPCRPCSITGDRPCFRHDRLCLAALRPEIILSKLQEKLR